MVKPELPTTWLNLLADLESAYLQQDDPIRQSGYGGGAARWRAEREPILDAINGDGDLLDIGCANGYLLECLVRWGGERGLHLTPYGLDYGSGLIALAQSRLPQWADHFAAGNGWNWRPSRRFRYVYTLYDCVPPEYLAAYVQHLLDAVVAPGGRLIIGAYGSRSRQQPPFDVAGWLAENSFAVAGNTQAGTPPIARFAWLDSSPDAV